MTGEEIRAAIKRLRECDNRTLPTIFDAFTCSLLGNHWCNNDVIEAIVALLEQADPDTHVELPKDRYGEHIRLGDKLEYLGYDDVWREPFEVDELRLRSDGWEVCFDGVYDELIARCRHYHKPTVEEVLRHVIGAVVEYAGRHHHDHELVDAYIGEVSSVYAAKLREVMADD